MSTPYSIALVTAPDKATADKLASGLVEAHLAACVNVVGGVASTYRWKGKVERAEELLLVIKTRSNLMPELSEFVRKNHSYSTPEVIAFPVDWGLDGYLDWLGANTRYAQPEPRRERA